MPQFRKYAAEITKLEQNLRGGGLNITSGKIACSGAVSYETLPDMCAAELVQPIVSDTDKQQQFAILLNEKSSIIHIDRYRPNC